MRLSIFVFVAENVDDYVCARVFRSKLIHAGQLFLHYSLVFHCERTVVLYSSLIHCVFV